MIGKNITSMLALCGVFFLSSYCFAEDSSEAQKKIAELESQLKALKASSGNPQIPEAVSIPTDVVKNETPQQKMVPGWVVRVLPAPQDLKTMSTDIVGSMIVVSARTTLVDHYKEKALSFYKGQAAYLFEGWFEVKSPGRHTFFADVELPPLSRHDQKLACSYWLELEGNQIMASGELSVSEPSSPIVTKNFVGGVDLVPGMYKARQWLTCVGSEDSPPWLCSRVSSFPESIKGKFDCNTQAYRASDHVSLTLRVKTPNDISPKDLSGDYVVHKAS